MSCPQLLRVVPIEAALLSTAESILAIAYLTEPSHPHASPIQGPVYATVAALDAARHLAKELHAAALAAATASNHGDRTPENGTAQPVQLSALRARRAAAAACGFALPEGAEEVLDACWLPHLDYETFEERISDVKVCNICTG